MKHILQRRMLITTLGRDNALERGFRTMFRTWDRFGRIIEQKWTNDGGSTVRDRTQYTFDRNSNVTARTNPQQTTLSEDYTFDGLDRLASTTRNGSAYQSWTLDGNGNWSSFTNQGSTQTRTHNAANEVATISGQTTPTHDAAGNLTQAPKPLATGNQVYVYDGWNRLTQVKETNGTVIATYEYDARGNRVQKTTGLTVRDYYHNESGQVVEVRVGGVLNQTIVWDLSFIDSPVMTKRDTGSDGTLDQSYYFTFDALRNVTSLINASNGNVLERYHYDAYGKVQMYNGSWGAISSSAYGNFITFTGRERDAESGLYYFRARYWDPSLGRFLARDPIGYVDGMNLYQGYFVHGGVDPTGLRVMVAADGTGQDWIPTPDKPISLDPGSWQSMPEMPESDETIVGYTANGRPISKAAATAIRRTEAVALGTAVAATSLAGGIWLWSDLGGGQFAVGISFGGRSVIPHITYGFGRHGAYTWAHGIWDIGMTETWGASAGTLTITEIPVIAPGAIGAWVATRPEVGSCAGSCIRAFCRGFWPY